MEFFLHSRSFADVAVHDSCSVSRPKFPQRRGHGHHPPAVTAAGQLPWRLRELHQNQGGPSEEPAKGVWSAAPVQRTHTGEPSLMWSNINQLRSALAMLALPHLNTHQLSSTEFNWALTLFFFFVPFCSFLRSHWFYGYFMGTELIQKNYPEIFSSTSF